MIRSVLKGSGSALPKKVVSNAELAKTVESRADWVGNREAQKSVARGDLVSAVRQMLGR